MRFNGEWLECDDGIVRPVIRGRILASNGAWRTVEFLVDTGADRTVLSASAFRSLGLPSRVSEDAIGGIGGLADSVTITAELQLLRDDGKWATFRGEYAACTRHEVLDMSVLGRDVTNLFAVIVDRPANLVAVIGQAHEYTIHRR